ncbi:hypothetical protein [Paenibacillus sp. 1P03SA]|uniref:hypothetical protein n=1 Tax=Paenibacillus sp. 1P03SA TaxID=3132294 RepID=UPI0039A004F5
MSGGKWLYRAVELLFMAGVIYLVRVYISVYLVRSVGLSDWQAAQVVWIILIVCVLVCAAIGILQGLQTYLKKRGKF